MKKLLLFSAAFLLGGTLCANALAWTSITTVTGTIPADKLSYIRTAYNGTLDLIEIHYQAWLGPADPELGNPLLEDMDGSWSTVTGGATMFVDESADPAWRLKTFPGATMLSPPTAPRSYLNFDAKIDGATWSRVGGSGNNYTSWSGGWYTIDNVDHQLRPVDDTPLDGIDETMIAKIFVSQNADVLFTGKMGLSTGPTLIGSFSTQVPEPGTIALLATGLVGLFSYAWRKRKRI